MKINISQKEQALLEQLLEIASGEWFYPDTLPEGIASVEEAKNVLAGLQEKLNKQKS